FGVLNFF
uniref:Venom peptide 6 n=1 Tax=Tityus serrulatus TaxID=6887 RepID=NDB4U_TITSE|nr:RecName: Full=Venom peptide 6 [Tityus serrulatus]